jgi:hypothetical protein
MSNRKLLLAIACAAGMVAGACGPTSISENRLKFRPAREASCALELVQLDPHAAGFDREWEIVGYVNIHETQVVDPFAEKYRRLVRPRACRMGGEAVTIMIAQTNRSLFVASSVTAYGVLRRRGDDVESPQAF